MKHRGAFNRTVDLLVAVALLAAVLGAFGAAGLSVAAGAKAGWPYAEAWAAKTR